MVVLAAAGAGLDTFHGHFFAGLGVEGDFVGGGGGDAVGVVEADGFAALAAGGLTLACLFFVADGVQVVTAQMLRAAGDVWLSTWVQVASYAVVMLPLAWALALPAGLGLSGILWAVTVASFMSAGLLVTRFARLARPGRVG